MRLLFRQVLHLHAGTTIGLLSGDFWHVGPALSSMLSFHSSIVPVPIQIIDGYISASTHLNGYFKFDKSNGRLGTPNYKHVVELGL